MGNRIKKRLINSSGFAEKVTALILTFAMVLLLASGAVPDTVEAASLKKPGTPKSVQAYPAKSNGVKVTWKKVSGASGYQIYRSTKKSGGFKAIKKVGTSKSSYTDTGLDIGTKYFYKVRAYTKKGGKTKWGSYSSVKSAMVGAKGLAAYGLKPNVKLGKSYIYKTRCWDNDAKISKGTVKFSSYKRIEDEDGYDAITLNIVFILEDDNARKYGASCTYSATDYYLYSEGHKDADLYDGNHSIYSLEYDGETYDECSVNFIRNERGWNGNTWKASYTLHARVPSGYDGIVVWVAGYPGAAKAVGIEKKLNSTDNLLMFRCN